MSKYVLSGFPYRGGKKANKGFHNHTVGSWINRLLPWDFESLYCEPFAGMLGVLLQRKPVCLEIVNDLNGDLVNWWTCVRDHSQELASKIYNTPHSRELHLCAVSSLKNGSLDGIDRAVAYSICLLSGTMDPSYFALNYNPTNKGQSHKRKSRMTQILALSERMRDVQIECKDALEVIDRVRKLPHALIYLDPPYPNTTYRYSHDIDLPLLFDLIKKNDTQASIALSVFEHYSELEHWTSNEYNRSVFIQGNTASPVKEILYTNFDPTDKTSQLDLFC